MNTPALLTGSMHIASTLNQIKNGKFSSGSLEFRKSLASLTQELGDVDSLIQDLNSLRQSMSEDGASNAHEKIQSGQRKQELLKTKIDSLYNSTIPNAAYEIECAMRARCDETSVSGLARHLDETMRKRAQMSEYIRCNSKSRRSDLQNVVNVRAHYLGMQAADASLQVILAAALGVEHGIDHPYMHSFLYQLNQLQHNNRYNTLRLDEAVYSSLHADISHMCHMTAEVVQLGTKISRDGFEAIQAEYAEILQNYYRMVTISDGKKLTEIDIIRQKIQVILGKLVGRVDKSQKSTKDNLVMSINSLHEKLEIQEEFYKIQVSYKDLEGRLEQHKDITMTNLFNLEVLQNDIDKSIEIVEHLTDENGKLIRLEDDFEAHAQDSLSEFKNLREAVRENFTKITLEIGFKKNQDVLDLTNVQKIIEWQSLTYEDMNLCLQQIIHWEKNNPKKKYYHTLFQRYKERYESNWEDILSAKILEYNRQMTAKIVSKNMEIIQIIEQEKEIFGLKSVRKDVDSADETQGESDKTQDLEAIDAFLKFQAETIKNMNSFVDQIESKTVQEFMLKRDEDHEFLQNYHRLYYGEYNKIEKNPIMKNVEKSSNDVIRQHVELIHIFQSAFTFFQEETAMPPHDGTSNRDSKDKGEETAQHDSATQDPNAYVEEIHEKATQHAEDEPDTPHNSHRCGGCGGIVLKKQVQFGGLWRSSVDAIRVNVFAASLCRGADFNPTFSAGMRYDRQYEPLNLVTGSLMDAARARDFQRLITMVEADFRNKITPRRVHDFCIHCITQAADTTGDFKPDTARFERMVAIFDQPIQALVRHVLFGLEALRPEELDSRLDFYTDLSGIGYDPEAKSQLYLSLELTENTTNLV